MADTEIKASNMKSQRGRGQNQDTTGSSTRERSLPIIPQVAPKNATVPGLDHQDALGFRLKDSSNVRAHDGMVSASSRVASIPKSLDHGRKAKK